jgi:hypothetical protein
MNSSVETNEHPMFSASMRKSGKGQRHGVVSELAAFYHVKPGHADAVREAIQQFREVIAKTDPKDLQRAGLRDNRFVMFDNDQRVVLLNTFDTDWVPYVDDAFQVIAPEHWLSWQQHCVESDAIKGRPTQADLRQMLWDGQTGATTYWNMFADYTIAQIKKALRVEQAFQQILDDPAAVEVLQHSALKPLLDQAAD